ncbi:hypothetical protein GLYMA_12G218100v4 [Glycine max]|nr:hypothetical protein GLYMA_12G218100v4 [Glycine max]KAH1144345.1 hypothetical protein GYH30_034530 [Glycine max]
MSVYNRIRAICSHSMRKFFVFSNEYHRDTYIKEMSGETKNDRNDRAIRVATQWYQNHLGGAVKVLLITNDQENKRKASEEGILAETVESYVKSLDQPDLLDLLVRPASEDVDMEEVEDLRPSKRKVIYSEHKPMSEITSGLHRGIYHQGKLRVNRYNPFEAYVGSESIGDEIIIYGRSNMNRAFDGDIEAAELLPQDQWQGVSSLSIAHEGIVDLWSQCLCLQGVVVLPMPCLSPKIAEFPRFESKPVKLRTFWIRGLLWMLILGIVSLDIHQAIVCEL